MLMRPLRARRRAPAAWAVLVVALALTAPPPVLVAAQGRFAPVNRDALKAAVDAWVANEDAARSEYGEIGGWDTGVRPQVCVVARALGPEVDPETAVGIIISGFCNEVFNELPLEFAAEVNQLMSLKLEGSVG